MSLWLEQRGICWICLQPMLGEKARTDHPLAPTEDHLRPRSKGGSNGKHNKLLAHRICNQERGNELPPMPISKFREQMIVRIKTCKAWPKQPTDEPHEEETDAYKIVRRFLAHPLRVQPMPPRRQKIRRDVVVKSSWQPGEAERAIRNNFGPQRGMGRSGDL